MILFCDSSALVKLYVEEEDTATMKELVAASEIVAVCRVAWAECMSALARRVREQPVDAEAIGRARQRFAADWPHCLALEVTQPLVELAGDYADTFALRAYDAVQLAAAQLLHAEVPGQVKFACFDARLAKAARVLGIQGG